MTEPPSDIEPEPGDAGSPAADVDAAGAFGLIDDPDVVAAAAEAGDRARLDPPLLSSLLRMVDDATSKVVDHPVRPRVKVTPAGLLRGEVDVVKVEVPAVLAAGLVIDRLTVRAERVRVAPGLPPRLRAGPVTLRAHVSQENVDRWTRAARLPIRVGLTADGVVLTTGVAGIKMSETVADLEVAGRFLRLVPKRMKIVGLPTTLVRFFRGYLPLPPLPRGARLTDVRHSPGELAVTFTLDDVDEALTPDVARRLRSLARLPLPGLR